MRALIVDDEPLSRSALAEILSHRRDIEQFDVAEDALKALEDLQRADYDVLLLDVRMPEMSGLDLVDHLVKSKSRSPAVVFVTAHQEYALAAFEKRALDYIVKPFSPAKVNDALDLAVSRSAQERALRLLDLLTLSPQPAGRGVRIAIKVKGRILFVDPAELVTAEASGNYVLLQQTQGSYLLRETISAVADKLEPHGFIRIHRSVLVNTAFVESIEPSSDDSILRMKNGKEYSVTRTYKSKLKGLAQFWIGADGF